VLNAMTASLKSNILNNNNNNEERWQLALHFLYLGEFRIIYHSILMECSNEHLLFV